MRAQADYSYRSDADVPAFADDRPLIVFDGECVFCSGWVKFALKHDKQQRYRFLAAQTPLGAALYRHYGLHARDYETNILIENGRANPTLLIMEDIARALDVRIGDLLEAQGRPRRLKDR